MEAIERDFGSFDIFRAEMTAKTIAIEGSGWGWLVSVSFVCVCAACVCNAPTHSNIIHTHLA